ncbi:TPA: hypothetical protein ACFJNM_001963, partial [Neisseria gonorrhoeae]
SSLAYLPFANPQKRAKKSPVTCRKQRALIFVNRPFLGTQYIRFQTALFSRRHSRAGGNPERKI